MLHDAATLIFSIYKAFILDFSTLLVFSFIALFIATACLLGFGARVLSRSSIWNALTSLAMLATNLLMAPLVYFAAEKAAALYRSLGIPSVPPEFWHGTPWLLVAIVGLMAKDFADYWCHRFLHTKFGWAIHAVHHSDTHVNAFTSFRVHSLELLLMKLFYIGLLSWLGIPPALIVGAYIFASLHNAYIHFEIDIDHGPLNWLIASPRFHRWHHADFEPAYGKNLANMIPLYDVIFGTYYRAGRCDVAMGAERDGIPATDPAKLLLLPFTLWIGQVGAWTQSVRARLRPGTR